MNVHTHKTHPLAIISVMLATLLTATGQFLFKLGTANLVPGWDLLHNWYLIGGFAIYGISAIILVISLKYGELSVLYPVISLSFVWVNIISFEFLGEDLNTFKWAGVSLIILGVSCIGFGSKNGIGEAPSPVKGDA
jgi:multidrug transporter EmrE-like cation transporter